MTLEELSEMLAEHVGEISADEISGGYLDTSKFYLDMSFPKPTGFLHIGDGVSFSYYHKLPNRFHRFMQRLILGFRWEKVKE